MNHPVAAVAAALALLVLGGCDREVPPAPPADKAPSPNASILPAPLASAPPATATTPSPVLPVRPVVRPIGSAAKIASLASAWPDQARPVASAVVEMPPAEPWRTDLAPSPDGLSARETAGLMVAAEWRWNDAPGPLRQPEVSAEGLAAARRLTAFKWMLALSDSGRMRAILDSRSFPLSLGAELRSRADRLGHMVVLPGGNEYRVAPPGALRALFGDRRLDVAPLASGEASPRGTAPSRFGLTVRRLELSAPLGSMTIDLGRLPEPSLGAALLCRALVELVAVEPTTALCAPGELPLRAQLSWRDRPGVLFEVQDMVRRAELPVGDLACPPLGAQPAQSLPPQPSSLLLTRDELAAFRLRPVDLGPADPAAPTEGLLARNATDSLRYLLVDGVPVAWLLPGQELPILGLPRGRYVVQWRTFLGDVIEPPRTVETPARVAIGEPPPPAPVPSSSATPVRSGP